MRTAWAWAKTLTDAEGNSLYRDTESGGDNQRAQLASTQTEHGLAASPRI